MKLCEFLKDYILFNSGMSQKEMALKCKTSAPTLNDILKGKRNIGSKMAKALAEVTGVPEIVLLTWQAFDDLNNIRN